MSTLKERLKTGEAVHGCWLSMGSSLSAEIVANAGFDWALVDLEHGPGTESTLIPQLQVLGKTQTTPLVRVESFEQARVQRVLDAGVEGVMFPRIKDAEEAKKAISHMYYPPKGKRGMAEITRATQYGKSFETYAAFAQKELLGIIQIETKTSLDHLDEIAAIDGADVLFIGPSDLSLALGVFRQFDHPLFVAAVKATGEAALKAGKAAGVLFGNPSQYDFYYQHGFRFLACGTDMTFLGGGASAMAKALNDQKQQNQ